jgi:gliding motility-associated-like protein
VSANNTAPNVTAGSSTPISCTTGLGAVSASSTTTGATYSWSGAGITSGGTTATPTVNAAGTYTVTVTDPSNGCTATAIATAVNSPGPTANAGTDVTIVSGTSTTLTATGGGTYAWSTGETTSSITVTPTTTTDYCVTVTDGNGCSDSSCVRVTVDIICGELFVPNAFSPNGDNFNDKFKVKVNPECVIEVQLFVYDRWGEKVFEGTTPQAACVDGWDGTFNGKALDNAVFVYYLNITLSNSPDVIKQKGNVSLIR